MSPAPLSEMSELMSANDDLPSVPYEIAAIREAVHRGIPVPGAPGRWQHLRHAVPFGRKAGNQRRLAAAGGPFGQTPRVSSAHRAHAHAARLAEVAATVFGL